MRKFGFFQNSRSTLLSWQKGLSTLARDAITEADSPVLLNPNYPPNGGDTVTYDSTDRTWKPLPVADKDGWIPIYETWTYSSATVVNALPNVYARFLPGDKIRLKQGGNYKYFYIQNRTTNTITFAANDTYSLLNESITDIAISRTSVTFGFPNQFFISSFTTGGFSSVSSQSVMFHVSGGFCFCSGFVAGTSNAAFFLVAPPMIPVTGTFLGTTAELRDNGTWLTNVGSAWLYTTFLAISIDGTYASAIYGWTSSGAKQAYFNINYPIQ